MQKNKFAFIICLITLLVFCSCDRIPEKKAHELAGQKIEKICEKHNQNIKFKTNNDIEEEKYLSSIYGVDLSGSEFYMQISISDPYKMTGSMTIGAFREIENYNSISNDFEQYYELIAELISFYAKQDITSEQINAFYLDNTNITKSNYPRKDEGLYYVIEKTADLNENCWIRYQIYTFLNEEGNGPEAGETFEEEWIIESYS